MKLISKLCGLSTSLVVWFVQTIVEQFGYHLIKGGYFSPITNIRELRLTKDIWAKRSQMRGIDIDLDKQVDRLRVTCQKYSSEYSGNKIYKYAAKHGLGLGFGYIEAQVLHSVIRHHKPANIVEVGGGISTYCMLHALEKNQQDTSDECSLTCIEPFPSKGLLALEKVNVINTTVQAVEDFSLIDRLSRNDILFIDSSHSVKPGSDVNFLILEVLPRLNSGVIVHFHDIYLPYDYTRKVLESYHRHWMETALLHAYLIDNSRLNILYCMSLLHYDRQEYLRQLFPDYKPQLDSDGLRDKKYAGQEHSSGNHFPGSIYLQVAD